MSNHSTNWDWEIGENKPAPLIPFQELKSYRHLVGSLIRKEFLLNYQQTILGPLWIIVQPLLTLFVYLLVFGRIMKLSTGEAPPILFYFSGIILWNFFSDSLMTIMNTFRDNVHIYSKVYLPKIIIPFSIIITQLVRFTIQLVLFFLLSAYFVGFHNFSFPNFSYLIMLPVAVFFTGILAFSTGLLLSLVTVKYRDIAIVASVGIRLLMFVTPVIYSLQTIGDDFFWLLMLNPLTVFFELFRFSLISEGVFNTVNLIAGISVSFVLLFFSLLLFKKISGKLIDVI